jgi:hypothetical protein
MVTKLSFNERVLQIAFLSCVLAGIACSLEPLTTNDLERNTPTEKFDAQSTPVDSAQQPDLAIAEPRDSAPKPDVAPSTCDETGIMNGEVVSACKDVGLAALVQFGGQRVCTLQGKSSFTLTQVPAGCPLLLTAHKAGYVRFSETLVVPKRGSLVRRIELMPEGGCNAPEPPENGCDCDAGVCTK